MHHHHDRHRERCHSYPRGGRFGRLLHERAMHGRGSRHGGGGRVFDQGDLRWVILKLISEKPSHGYELIKAIEERLGGAYSPSPGVIYPTLTLLEEMGYAHVAAGDGGKKLHSITPEGEAALAANKPAIDAIFGRIDQVRAAHGGG